MRVKGGSFGVIGTIVSELRWNILLFTTSTSIAKEKRASPLGVDPVRIEQRLSLQGGFDRVAKLRIRFKGWVWKD